MTTLKKYPLLLFILMLVLPCSLFGASKNFPTDVEMNYTEKGKGKVTFAELLDSDKPTVIYFWSTRCPHCVEHLPQLMKDEKVYSEHGIKLVVMHTDKNRSKADRLRSRYKAKFPWLSSNKIYNKYFGIKYVPRVIVLSADFKVEFNGHPGDEGLKPALAKYGVK